MRHQRADSVYRIDDVGAGLPEDDDQHSRFPVGQTGVAQVLHRIFHLGDIRKAYCSSLPVAHNQGPIQLGFEELICGAKLPGSIAVCQLSLGPVGVGRVQYSADLVHTDSVLV